VSQSAFDEVFQSAEECFSAAFEEGLARLSSAVDEAVGHERHWLARVRCGLVALLGFLDDEPGWGRLLIVEASIGGAAARERSRRVRSVLARLVGEGHAQAIAGVELERVPELTMELVVGGVFSVIWARMSEREGSGASLVELAPSLLSFIAVAIAGGLPQAQSAQEAAWPQALCPPREAEPTAAPQVRVSPRTALVLDAIAHAPRSSNREIAAAAGLGDEGQTSHLLRRLAQRGLIEKVTPRSGSRRENAWLLTPSGRRVLDLLELLDPATAAASHPRTAIRASVREAA
jgi:DNA-binding MarR family transcriptional regulator